VNTDVIVIGTGQGGVPLATKLADQGKQVIIIERSALGGTCVNSGCTPTKTMVASARAAHVARRAGPLGIRVSDVQVDLPAVVDRKNAMVARWRQGIERRLASAGDRLRLVRGHARFVDQRTVQVDGGERFTAETVVINVGAGRRSRSCPGWTPCPGRTTPA
jgi:pyruvate/2-oxoglutarate dehydrogenase complex dihydrolipoamide dehydrogenase (E3) component